MKLINMKSIKMKFKRLFLIFPIASGIILGVVEQSRLNYYGVMTMLALSTYSILINVPYFSKFMHRKPIYFEDLQDKDFHDYYQRIFIRTINIPLSIFSAFLAGYFIYKIKGSELSVFEKVGVVGGVISIFNNFQKRTGQILIDFLHWYKDRSRKKVEIVDSNIVDSNIVDSNVV